MNCELDSYCFNGDSRGHNKICGKKEQSMKIRTYLSGIFTMLVVAISINAQTEKTIAAPAKSAPVISSAESKPVAPAFNLISLDGKKFDLASLRGKVVVLNFWFTGCPPCLTEIPKLNELVEKFQNQEVVFIAPTWDNETVLQNFLKKTTFKYNVVANAGDIILGSYSDGTGNVAMPTHMIIDKEGNIETKLIGGLIKTDGSTKQLEEFTAAITRLVKKPYVRDTVKTIIP